MKNFRTSRCQFSMRILICLLIISAFGNPLAKAADFFDLVIFSGSPAEAIFEGNSLRGNSWTDFRQYTNISSKSFVIHGVADVQTLDPEDLGYQDLNNSNGRAVLLDMEVTFPTYDLFGSNVWNFDTTRKSWITETSFDDSFPIFVAPGDSFSFVSVNTNDELGPDFSPRTDSFLTFAQAGAIGELVFAIDLDWALVPEPNSMSLFLTAVAFSFAMERQRK